MKLVIVDGDAVEISYKTVLRNLRHISFPAPLGDALPHLKEHGVYPLYDDGPTPGTTRGPIQLIDGKWRQTYEAKT